MKFRIAASLENEKGVRVRFIESETPNRLSEEKELMFLNVSVPKKEKRNRWAAMMLARTVISIARRYEISRIIVSIKEFTALFEGASVEDMLDIFAVNADMANYQYLRYKEKPKEGWKRVEDLLFVIPSGKKKKMEEIVRNARITADAITFSRDLSNTPGGHMTPELLAQSIKKAVQGIPIQCKILKEKEMKRLGMGGILGVAQGSKARPRCIILEYNGIKTRKEKSIVFVGKGVTYDSGGIDTKGSPYGIEMKMDMSGGAAVAAAVIALARKKVRKNIVAIIPAVENMPSGESYRPGDILRSFSGKTIEVLNTDAEGRIILADALSYARKRYAPHLVIDVATLTGAAEVALGKRASAIFSNDETLIDFAKNCGEDSGDRMWPFPLWQEYEEDIVGNFGDIANMQTKGDWREGGTIIAAVFLWQFAKEFPQWLHIDMAPRMTPVHDEVLAKGSAGTPVRFLVKFVETFFLKKEEKNG